MVFCQNSWSQSPLTEIPKPDFSCLTRYQKERIEICFEQDNQCRLALEKSSAPESPSSDLVYFLGTLMLGGFAGALIYAQVHK